MGTRVTAALHAVRFVAERIDPLEDLAVGRVAEHLRLSLSAASRLCGDLEAVGLLARGDQYGSYRLGLRSIRLSGAAAAATAQPIRFALTRAAQQTGETVCLVAGAGSSLRVIDAVVSAWTLFASAEIGELVQDEDGAISRAARSPEDTVDSLFEVIDGMRIEIAAPIRGEDGEVLAVIACRLPSNRTQTAASRARQAVLDAKTYLEGLSSQPARAARQAAAPQQQSDDASSLEAAARLLETVPFAASTGDLSRHAGVSVARARRMIESGVEAGLLRRSREGFQVSLSWGVHAWHKAAAFGILTRSAAPLVSAASEGIGQCAFITALRGMRSVTLVERLAPQPRGLAMIPWLGRPCPIVHADAGPTLLLDFDESQIPSLIPGKPAEREVRTLLTLKAHAQSVGVLSKESVQEGGQIAVSAPIRDSSGLVVAAALLVGPTDVVRDQIGSLERRAAELAADVSDLLGGTLAEQGITGSVRHRA